MTYPREVYETQPDAAATRLARELTGSGISRQSWALGPKILEVAGVSSHVYEVHPEVSFRHLAGRALVSKKTWAGQIARREALNEAKIVLPDDLGEAGAVPPDDVLDAAVAAWSGSRIARGAVLTLPAGPAPGEPRIWY